MVIFGRLNHRDVVAQPTVYLVGFFDIKSFNNEAARGDNLRKNFRLGDMLLNAGKITEKQLHEAINTQKKIKTKRLGEVLVDLGYVKEEDILEILEKQLDIPIIDLSYYYIDPKITALVPENIARKYDLIPIDIIDGELLIVMSDPSNIYNRYVKL